MASADSGVETGNESNDGPLDSKPDSSRGCFERMFTAASNVYPTLSERSSLFHSDADSTESIFGTGLFKFPTSSLPTGFGESYESHSSITEETTSHHHLKRHHRRYRHHSCIRELRRKKKSCILKSFISLLPLRSSAHILERGLFLSFGKHLRILIPNLGVCLLFGSYKFAADAKTLRIAASSNNIESVQSSLHRGADPNCVDRFGRSPLHLASCSGYSDIVKLLLESGANPNLRDKLGNTPLHLAACTNNISVVTLLLKAGTDVSSSDQHGRSPLQLAQSKLKLLQRHMLLKNPLEVSIPATQNHNDCNEIPIYDNSFIAKQVLQIIEMMKLYLQKRGQDSEAELLDAFSSRLTLSETKEHVKDLLDRLSDLSLDSSNPSTSSSVGNHIISNTTNSLTNSLAVGLFLNAPSQSAPPCLYMSSTSSPAPELAPTSFSLHQNNQL